MIDRSTERTRLLAPRSAEEPTALTTEEGCGGAKNGCSGGVAHSPPPPPLKSIGRLGSIAIAVNSLAGPAVLQLPFCYQQSGLIPTTLCLMGVAVLSALACLHTANVVSLMPQTQTTASAASNRSSAASNRSSAAAIPGTTHDEKHDPPINGNHLNPKFAQNNDASTATVAGALSTFTTNVNFEAPVEFSDPYRVFWHQKAYICTQILFYLAVVALNVASIIDTAQVADAVLGVHATSYAWTLDRGMALQAWSSHGPCTIRQSKLHICDPFQNDAQYGSYILSLGYLVTAVIFVPICLKDLKENTNWQIFGFGILMTLSLYFCFAFWDSGKITLHHASLWGRGGEWSSMLGVILVNFCLVLAIPAWLHEKKESVSVVKTVVVSTCIATALYIGVGMLGALAISHVHINLLTPMMSGAYGEGIQVAASVFAFFIIGLDIPLFSVLTRYNLTHSGLCSVRMANLLVVVIPWGTAWIFYQGDAIEKLLDWSGIVLTSTLAFLLPFYLALRVLQQTAPLPAKNTDVMTDDPSVSPDPGIGSIRVYGNCGWLSSRKAQIVSLYVLLAIASTGVFLAIGGQIYWAVEREEVFLRSEAYLNDTDYPPFLSSSRSNATRFVKSLRNHNTNHRFLKGATSTVTSTIANEIPGATVDWETIILNVK